MASLTQEIGALVTATNLLTARVEELLATIDTNIESRVQVALDAMNLTATINDIINAKIATGEIGSNATTLGGQPLSAFVLKTDSIDADTFDGKMVTDFVLKTDTVDLGGL